MNTAEPINQDTCIMMELTLEIDNMVNFGWPQNVHITRFHCILKIHTWDRFTAIFAYNIRHL